MTTPLLDGPSPTEVVLVDLSSIAYPIWHTTQADPDPNKASQQIVSRVRSLAEGHPAVAICCDGGRSFRKDIAETYKANRPPQEAMLQHQIELAREQFAADGFPVWCFPGFEADDVIASAVARLTAPDSPASISVLIVSADKDLLQLVGPRVKAKSVRDGSLVNSEGVGAKFGVRPEQMRDYLTIVGDTADNIVGAKGIGAKKAAELLAKFGSLDALYQQLEAAGGAALGIAPAVSQSLRTFKHAFETTRSLVTLRTDVPVPVEELMKPRVPTAGTVFSDFGVEDEGEHEPDADVEPDAPLPSPRIVPPPSQPTPVAASASPDRPSAREETGMAVRGPDLIVTAPAEWERGLDPRSMKDARVLARDMYDSRMFSAYGTPQGVLSTLMVGRELGLPAMASLRSIHIIEGRHALSAALMVALVLKSGMAEYFEPLSFSDKEATFETKRKGARNPIKLQHTIEMAVTAGLVKKDSNWQKTPTDMLVARAQSRLARMIYPDLLAGLYTPDELSELREQVA